MAQVGQWDHRELAARLENLKEEVYDDLDQDTVTAAAAALRDLGDGLQALLNAKEWKDKLDACGAGRKSAYEECARLAEEEAAKYHVQSVSYTPLKLLAAKFRQLALEKEADHAVGAGMKSVYLECKRLVASLDKWLEDATRGVPCGLAGGEIDKGKLFSQ